MIILSATTDNVQAVLASSVTTSQLQCIASWRDITSSAYTPGRTVTATNDTTAVNVVPAPASSTKRVVDFISVYNADTADATVTIKFDANGTEYVLWKDVLASGDSVQYVEGAGFVTQRTLRPIKSFTVHGDAGSNWTLTNATLAERFAGSGSSRTVFGVDLEGYTQVRLRANLVVASTSANTPIMIARYNSSFSTNYAAYSQLGSSGEVQIALDSAGYKDTGWVDLATAARTTGIFIGFIESGGDGAADPAFGATDILFR